MTYPLHKIWLASALVALVSTSALAQEAPPQPRPDDLQTDMAANGGGGSESVPLTNGLAGPYLAARIAAVENDFTAAARYFRQAVLHDPQDRILQDNALIAMISAGQMDQAAELSNAMTKGSADVTDLAGLVLRAQAAKNEDWAGLLTLIEGDGSGETGAGAAGPLLDGMLASWARLGAGDATAALEHFEALRMIPSAAAMLDYQLAMARGLVGDYEGAQKLLEKGAEGGPLMGYLARAQVLAQLDRRDEALASLENLPESDSEPQIVALRRALEAGEDVVFDAVGSPREGIAQVFLTFASALAGSPEPEPLALIHARLAGWIAPDMGDARLITAQILQMQNQFDLAEVEFDALRRLGQMRPVAELSRIDALARAKRYGEAEKAALALTAAHPDLAPVWVAQGDLLRQQDKFGAAVPAYDKALSLLGDDNPDARWFPLYARGISLERTGQFDRAEADLRAALEIRPEQPSLLNYLGYSWIDRNENLEEGLALIQKAVELAPEDGYIQDSLAWAYFRLGRYADAVAPMEAAARSMSADPLINDHLGDIYWMVGRKREAEIQWHRALSLKPTQTEDDVDPARIRDKLERGLDAVLKAEGVVPATGGAQTSVATEGQGGGATSE